MKMNKWTLALAAVGLVSLTSAQADEAKLVPTPVLSSVSQITLDGYVDTSAQWNLGTGHNQPAPFAFNNADKQDGFNVNAVDLRISKAADEAQWSAGFMVDLMFGPDTGTVTGNPAGVSDNGFGGLSDNLRQAYVDLRAPIGTGLGLKIGRFDSLLGYESTDSYKNPNFTRSYGYTLEPTENTGVIAHYNFAEWLAVDAGIANTVTTYGINTRSSTESKKAYLGLVTLTAPKCWGFLADDTLVAGVSKGPGSAGNDRTHVYVGSTLYTPLKGLTFGAAYDVSWDTDVMHVDTGFATAVAGYVAFKPEQSKWGVAGRVEYAKGNFLDSNSSGFPVVDSGFDKVLALTGTVSYDLWQNVLTRAEVRWDHALNSNNPINNQNNAVALIANVVYKF